MTKNPIQRNIFAAVCCSLLLAYSHPAGAADGVRFSGKIAAFENTMPADGALRIKVDDNWIILNGGDMPPQEQVKGTVEGIDLQKNPSGSIGKKADVFARRLGPHLFSLFGSADYFVKVKTSPDQACLRDCAAQVAFCGSTPECQLAYSRCAGSCGRY